MSKNGGIPCLPFRWRAYAAPACPDFCPAYQIRPQLALSARHERAEAGCLDHGHGLVGNGTRFVLRARAQITASICSAACLDWRVFLALGTQKYGSVIWARALRRHLVAARRKVRAQDQLAL